MSKTNDALWKDYGDVNEKLKVINADDERYEMLLDERDKLRNELIKLEQVKMETEVKKSQIEADDKREKTRNMITIGTFTVTTGISIWTVLKTFKFDETSTITSTLGRNSVTNVVSKIFKK